MVDLGRCYSQMQFKDFKDGYSIPCTDKSGPVGPVSKAPVLLHDILVQLELSQVSDTSGEVDAHPPPRWPNLQMVSQSCAAPLSQIKHSRDGKLRSPQHL